MKKYRFYLTSGRSFVVTCKDAVISKDSSGAPIFKLIGVSCNKPEFLDPKAVAALVALGPDTPDTGDANDKG